MTILQCLKRIKASQILIKKSSKVSAALSAQQKEKKLKRFYIDKRPKHVLLYFNKFNEEDVSQNLQFKSMLKIKLQTDEEAIDQMFEHV